MTRTTMLIQVIVNLVFGILVLLFVRRYMKYLGNTIDIGAWGVFYTVFGVLYAIIIGFILISALGKFDQLKLAVDSEVSEIQSIRILLQYFSDNQIEAINNIRKTLFAYVHSIHSIEWDDMIKKDSQPEFSEELRNVRDSVSHLKSEDENDSIALTSIINTLSGLTECRTKRISLANEEIPGPIMKLLFFMSIILIFGLIVMGVQNFWVHLFMVSSLSITLQLIINLLTDLNNPFTGIWVIEKKHYLGIIESIDKRIIKD